MKNLIKTDINYFIRSKVLICLVLLFAIFMGATCWMTYQFNRDSLREYNKMYDYLLNIDADIEKEKATDYIIHDDGIIENPLSYDLEQVENALSYITPQNSTMLFGESCTLFLPIIAFLVGIVLVSYEDKNKTLKLKVTNYGKTKLSLSKQLSGIIILLFLLVVAFIIIKVTTCIMYSKLQSEYEISIFKVNIINSNKSFLQLLFTFFSAIVYFELGYCISNLFHCYTIIAVAISAISFFLPALFRYDFVNVKSTLERCFFDFKGVVVNDDSFSLSVKVATMEIIAITLIIIIANHIVSKKRSAYA